MATLTPSEVEAAEARANALPPGDWHPYDTGETEDTPDTFVLNDTGRSVVEVLADWPGPAKAVAEFIAHSKVDVPRLCEALREAWADNAWMRQEWEACVERDKASFEEVKDRRAERDALKERILALEAKCTLLGASLKQADTENEELKSAITNAMATLDNPPGISFEKLAALNVDAWKILRTALGLKPHPEELATLARGGK